MKMSFLEEIVNRTPKMRRRRASLPAGRQGGGLFILGSETPLAEKNPAFELDARQKHINTLFFALLSVLTLFAFLTRAYFLQIIQGHENKALAEGNRVRAETIVAERGLIYDRNKDVLVRNIPAFGVELNTQICANGCSEVIGRVEKFIGSVERPLLDQSDKTVFILARNLSKEEILPLEANLNGLPGVSVSVVPTRYYLYGDALAHVVGYVGLDASRAARVVGKVGVEESYDGNVSGISGSRVVQIDAGGKTSKILSEKSAIPGRSVVLYLDRALQLKAYELLKEAAARQGAPPLRGAVVAQDTQTGGILAMGN